MTPEEEDGQEKPSAWPPPSTQPPPQRVLRLVSPQEVYAGRVSFGMFVFTVIATLTDLSMRWSLYRTMPEVFAILGGFLASFTFGVIGIRTRLGKAGLVMTLLTAAIVVAIVKWLISDD